MIWSAFVIGLMGSLHCVGMCGPLALAVPVKSGHRLTSALIYNSGRIVTYSLLGVIMGLFGRGIQLAGYQSHLSILAGLFVISWVFYQPFGNWISRNIPFSFGAKIRNQIARRIVQPNYPSIFLIGVLNGLLPCGLIYLALVAALETGYVELAAIYMVLFGLGTALPLIFAMLSRQFFANFKLLRHRLVIPVFSLFLGILFITRGVIFLLPTEQQNTTLVETLAAITLCKLNDH